MVAGALLQYRENPYLLGGQLTSWKVITSQRFSHRSESSEPHIKLPTLGSLASRGVPTESSFAGQRGVSAGAPQHWEKHGFHSWSTHTCFHMYWDPGQSTNSIEALARPTCESQKVSWGAGVGSILQLGGKSTDCRCPKEYSPV